MVQSERTKNVASACKEVNERFSVLLENGVHSYSKTAIEKKNYLVKFASRKYGITEETIKLIIKK